MFPPEYKASVAYPGILIGWGGGKFNKFSSHRAENGDQGAVIPKSGVPLTLQMSETHILIRMLWMYFPRNWEFGPALSKLRNFGAGKGFNPQSPSVRHCKAPASLKTI
jgi:hypothetical protein